MSVSSPGDRNFNRYYYIRLPAVWKLPFTTLSVLDILAFGGPKRLTELIKTEQINQPGLTQLITRLEREVSWNAAPTRRTDAPPSTSPTAAERSARPGTRIGAVA